MPLPNGEGGNVAEENPVPGATAGAPILSSINGAGATVAAMTGDAAAFVGTTVAGVGWMSGVWNWEGGKVAFENPHPPATCGRPISSSKTGTVGAAVVVDANGK